MSVAISVSYPAVGQLQSFFFVCNMNCLSSLMVALVCVCVCSCHSGTKENLSTSKILLDMWTKVQSDAEKHAAFLLR